MNRYQTLVRLPSLVLLMAACLALAGCTSTPRHTNTLIFGTNTVVGLNVAQESAASAGVIVGYKRQEAVWMPLLPNQAPSGAGEPAPAPCTEKDKCPKFESTSPGKTDTYSVLASFGARYQGSAGGTAGAQADGGIAQYFATGIAAQLLAQSGGASLVNTAAADPLTPSERAAGRAARATLDQQATQLVTKLMAADGKSIDMGKLDTLMTNAKLSVGSQAYLKDEASVGPDALKSAMLSSPNVLLLPLLN